MLMAAESSKAGLHVVRLKALVHWQNNIINTYSEVNFIVVHEAYSLARMYRIVALINISYVIQSCFVHYHKISTMKPCGHSITWDAVCRNWLSTQLCEFQQFYCKPLHHHSKKACPDIAESAANQASLQKHVMPQYSHYCMITAYESDYRRLRHMNQAQLYYLGL